VVDLDSTLTLLAFSLGVACRHVLVKPWIIVPLRNLLVALWSVFSIVASSPHLKHPLGWTGVVVLLFLVGVFRTLP
jgi:hypothetical protein